MGPFPFSCRRAQPPWQSVCRHSQASLGAGKLRRTRPTRVPSHVRLAETFAELSLKSPRRAW
eukprot:264469-Prymnesium_polylepis.1